MIDSSSPSVETNVVRPEICILRNVAASWRLLSLTWEAFPVLGRVGQAYSSEEVRIRSVPRLSLGTMISLGALRDFRV